MVASALVKDRARAQPSSVPSLMWTLSFAVATSVLTGSSTRARGTGAGAQWEAATWCRWYWQARSLGSFQLAVSMLKPGLSKVCVCNLEKQSLTLEPSGKPHWFSNQLKEAVRLQGWCSYYVTWTPHYPRLWVSPCLLGLQLAMWFQTTSLLFSSYQTPCDLSL